MSGTRRAFTLGLISPLLARGQTQPQIQTQPRPKLGAADEVRTPPPSLRIDANLVLVPVTVCDPYNRPVMGLEKEHFRVLDDKVEQTITHFAMDDEPVAVGLVFDISGSMQ